jgi:SOUL heme-binding protein
MGSIVGKEAVAEPAYKVLMSSVKTASTPYEIRQYGERFAAETIYPIDASNNIPFRKLAEYIGVFGTPQNLGSNPIAMTAPVAMKTADAPPKQERIPIAMTAPVSMKNVDGNSDQQRHQVMTFYLPSKYTNINDIPKPTNPDVTIRCIPGAVGAVHRFSGTMEKCTARNRALQLRQQLLDDGASHIKDDDNISNQAASLNNEEILPTFYEAWGYNPPFTIPAFRRNEIWIELTTEQVEQLLKRQPPLLSEPTAESTS